MEEMVSIIIPAYNEEEAIADDIETILATMKETSYRWELIVVNDGSTDRTREIVERYPEVRLVNHPYNLGGGAARNTGIRRARGDIVVIADGDGTYPLQDIPRLVEALEDYDMVVGARTKEAGTMKLLRTPAKWFIRKLAEFMTNSRIPDLNSGMRAMRKETFMKFIDMLPQGHSWVSTITLSFLSRGYLVGYLPIDYYPRKGKSTFKPVKDSMNYLMLVYRTVIWFNPLRIFLPLALLLLLGGVGKAVADMLRYQLHIATSTVVILISSLQIFTIGLVADLISKRTGL
ncbi:MAG: glycosyltransferase family 2 protein [Actinobacteria bacterium]|nr:glycosyltransferase family 2 protein [Actinomycetota bacterium]